MESILKEIRTNNVKHQILPSENKVIDRLLEYPVEMQSLYDELSDKLSECQKRNLWGAILGAATFWNPEASKVLREEKKKLFKLKKDIAECADSLAAMIKARRDICETSGIIAYQDCHFLHWVNRAARDNHYYQGYVKEDLDALNGRFDLKYWPDNHDVVAAIGEFAQESEIYASDSWTEELLSSPKHSMADYLRVILKAVEETKEQGPPAGLLSADFRLSDNALAVLINCTLDLSPEDSLSSENIKRSRQNIRGEKLRKKRDERAHFKE